METRQTRLPLALHAAAVIGFAAWLLQTYL